MSKLFGKQLALLDQFDLMIQYAQQFEQNLITREQLLALTDSLPEICNEFKFIHAERLLAVQNKPEELEDQRQIGKNFWSNVNSIKKSLAVTPHEADARLSASAYVPTPVSLPSLSLPQFSGDILKYSTFSSQFLASVRSTHITDCQRLQYLLSSLSGEPLSLIAHLEIIDEHWKVAWDILENKYHNKRVVMELHINQLLDFNPISSGKLENLQFFYSFTIEQTKALENLGVSTEDFIWFVLIGKKLDQGTRRAFERSRGRGSELPKLSELLSFVSHEINALQSSCFQSTLSKGKDSRTAGHLPKRSTLLTHSQNSRACMYFMQRISSFISLQTV